ncbi:hypothetical protein N180_07440 [Pedobacter antarcticus 4BY]|uniref:Beta-lactamase-related domain-containing protein n=2 Tax=Pedobacter antarcticus TaxID=34086 RepID=A0A081PF99_9SPHI|nr:serine hydrolase domain-containing protein [Pedobacter antarcticus]KEQ29372.1 hypothetical protein N180_07440 [Pedobacter antarcticus 4BY]SFE78503.1 CubicO group peptidase, beta-lactamase class C family [Pedobacter antarcticus]
MRTKFLFIIISIFISFNVKAQLIARSIDSILTTYVKNGQFDGSILIGKGSKVIYAHQYGLANRQFHVPITSTTKFPVASITKLYTAILILKLQEEKKLDINKTIDQYIPDILPESSTKITIKQLLTHTSGLPKEKIAAYKTRFNITEFIEKNIVDTLLTKPGTRYDYNNVNYILLGAIIESVSGKNWRQVLSEKIIQPLSLENTGLIQTDSVINNLAYGYHNYAFGDLPAKPLKNDAFIYMENYATAGAIFTTPEELFKLHLALAENKLLNSTSKKLMYAPEINLGLVDGTPYFVTLGSYYGSRQFKGQTKPIDVIERTGNINGFNTIYIQLPLTKETIIIFCNTDAGDLNTITDELLNILISSH